jgi:hypothetical protein
MMNEDVYVAMTLDSSEREREQYTMFFSIRSEMMSSIGFPRLRMMLPVKLAGVGVRSSASHTPFLDSPFLSVGTPWHLDVVQTP